MIERLTARGFGERDREPLGAFAGAAESSFAGRIVVIAAETSPGGEVPALGKIDMSAPISATITSAVGRCTPGTVQSSSTAAAKGRICSLIASESRSICSSRKSRWARIAETTIPCSTVEAALEPRALEDLVQPVGLPLALLDLHLAVARQIAERPDRLRQHEARLEQARLE
jgi:hypothetical protein